MRPLLLCLLLSFVGSIRCSGYFVKKVWVKQFNVESGLPQNSVIDILQDSEGFIWISTSGGVRKTDGEKIYELTGSSSKPVNDMQSAYMAIDNRHNIWFASAYQIAVYDHIKRSFSVVKQFQNTTSPFNVVLFSQLNGDQLYFYKRDEGLFSINTLTWKLCFIGKKDYYLAKSPNQIFYIYIGEKKAFYYFLDGWFYRIDLSTLREQKLLQKTDTNGFRTFEYFHANFLPETSELIRNNKFIGGFAIGDTKSILAYAENSTYKVDLSGTYKLQLLLNQQGATFSPGQTIHKQITDRWGNLWTTTLNSGLWMIGNHNNLFTAWFNSSKERNFVRSIYHDQVNKQVVATLYRGGFSIFDEAGNFLTDDRSFSNCRCIDNANVTNTIQPDSDHYILFTQKAPYTFIADLRRKTIKPISLIHEPTVEPFSFYTTTEQIAPFTFLAATMRHVYALKRDKDSIVAERIYASDNTIGGLKQFGALLHIGEIGGFSILNRSSGSVRRIKLSGSVETLVKGFYRAPDDRIYIATTQGMYVWDHKTEPTLVAGLPNEFIYGIIPASDAETLCLPCNKGIMIYQTKSKEVYHFTSKDGIISNECNTNAYCKLPDGRILIGSIDGICAFDPSDISRQPKPAQPTITGIIIDGNTRYDDSLAIATNAVHLSYKQSDLTFTLADLSYIPDHARAYRYRLNGRDTAWRHLNSAADLALTLQPGSYRLEIQTCNVVTHKNSVSTALAIIIEPPFWKKWWFYLAEALIVGCVVYASGLLLHKRKLKQEMTKLYLQQSLQQERERISRELHDNLGAQATALNAGIRHLQQHTGIAPEALKNVTETSGKIMQNLRESIWALNNQQISLLNLSDRYKVFVRGILKNFPELKLNYKELVEDDYVLMPVAALNLLRMLQEALHNTVKHARATEIWVNIEATDHLKIVYRDNGRGFDVNAIAGANSNGLQNMQLRADEANLIIHIESAVGFGTTITITQNRSQKI